MGAEAVQTMLRELDLDKLSAELKAEIETLTSKERNRDTEGQKRAHAVKRLEVVESFRASGNKPEWMVLTVLPVIRRICARWCSWTAAASPRLT